MRTSTRFSRGWNPIGRLVGSAGLVVLWMVVVGMMRPADTWADTVVMLDGSKVEGTIMAEDEKSITIEAAFAGGAIVQKKVIDKSTVKEVVRLTEAQRAAQSRERDFAAVNRYQLNPASSFSVEEYDRAASRQGQGDGCGMEIRARPGRLRQGQGERRMDGPVGSDAVAR
jgi:hypothetical protein